MQTNFLNTLSHPTRPADISDPDLEEIDYYWTKHLGLPYKFSTGFLSSVPHNCGGTSQEDESSVVLDAITTGVGLAPFFQQLDALFSCKQFTAALSGPRPKRQAAKNSQRSKGEGGRLFSCTAPPIDRLAMSTQERRTKPYLGLLSA